MTNKTNHKIAVIPGDGIGNEVVPEGIRVLEAAGKKFDIGFEFKEFDWSCERFHNVGSMMPEDGIAQLKDFDSIFLGAVGFPGVPDHVSLWGLLIPIRREMNQYVNLRPIRLLKGVESPLKNRTLRILIFTWCAKTTKASTRKLVDVCMPARIRSSPCRKIFSRAKALIESSDLRLSWRVRVKPNT